MRCDTRGWRQEIGGGLTHTPLSLLLLLLLQPPLPQTEELLVLPGDKVDGGVLQQRGEHEQQTHGHPDVDGFHVGDLRPRCSDTVRQSYAGTGHSSRRFHPKATYSDNGYRQAGSQTGGLQSLGVEPMTFRCLGAQWEHSN